MKNKEKFSAVNFLDIDDQFDPHNPKILPQLICPMRTFFLQMCITLLKVESNPKINGIKVQY